MFNKKKHDASWFHIKKKNLLIHNSFFDKGLLLVKSPQVNNPLEKAVNYATNSSFIFDKREIVMHDPTNPSNLDMGYSLHILFQTNIEAIAKNPKYRKTLIVTNNPTLSLSLIDADGSIKKIFDDKQLSELLIHLELGYLLLEKVKKTEFIEKSLSYQQITELNHQILSKLKNDAKISFVQTYKYNLALDATESIAKLEAEVESQYGNLLKLPTPDADAVNRARKLIGKVPTDLDKELEKHSEYHYKKTPVLFTPKRRDEIFLPFYLKTDSESSGLYLYPWLTVNKKDLPNSFAFDIMHSLGCLFGPVLKATNQHGNTFPIIKHELPFYQQEKFVSVSYDIDGFSYYEKLLFTELKKYIAFVNQISNQKKLLYHLPSFDYIIFIGVELFERGRITLAAFNHLCLIILKKQDEHKDKISKICEKFNVAVTFSSPFDNLLAPLNHYNGEDAEIAKTILQMLNLPCEDKEPIEDSAMIEKIEKNLVNICLEKLTSNEFNSDHKIVWEDFSKVYQINNLEELVQTANAVMIAVAAANKQDYKTCTLAPLSEKQVQISYSKFYKQARKHNNLTNTYPAVVNLTAMDHLITYDSKIKNNGKAFYTDINLSAIFNKKILKQAHENVCLFSKHQPSNKLTDIFKENEQIKSLRKSR